MYFIEPLHLQGQTKGLFGSAMSKQMRHNCSPFVTESLVYGLRGALRGETAFGWISSTD